MSDNPLPQPPHQPPLRPTEPHFLPYQEGQRSENRLERRGVQAEPVPGIVPAASNRYAGYPPRGRKARSNHTGDLGSPGEWMWVLIAASLLGVTIVASLGLFLVLQAARGDDTPIENGPAQEPTSALYGVGGILDVGGDQAVGGLLGDQGQSMLIHPWDGKERCTLLRMGLDRRPGENATYRTDTMMLISLDPVTNSVGILSIPRDLYVDVPGFGIQRINTAYGVGELSQPGGGARLAMQTVQYNFGIPVNDYAVVDFDSFIRIVDLLGGITVNVEKPISDPLYPDMNYGYDPFYLAAGPQQLDGRTALKYARSRHGSDDIDRARRQQQVLYAIRDKVLALDMLSRMALEAPALWSELDAGIDTGLALDQIMQLAWWLKDIPATNFTSGIVGWEYVIPQNWQGQDILVPDRARIGALMVQVFGPNYNPYR